MVNTTVGSILLIPAVIKAGEIKLDKPEPGARFWKYIDLDKLFKFEDIDEERNGN